MSRIYRCINRKFMIDHNNEIEPYCNLIYPIITMIVVIKQ